MVSARSMDHKPMGQPSSWTDFDFGQIQYEYAHLGTSIIRDRGWTAQLFPKGVLALDATQGNPYWGGGLLCSSRISQEAVNGASGKVDIDRLNAFEYLFADTPMFGAWCRDNDDIVFIQFIPNFMKGLPFLTDLLIAWARRRMRSLPNLLEVEPQVRMAS
jgi:hypothetical protein